LESLISPPPAPGPTVSIVIATYNRLDRLRRTLLKQVGDLDERYSFCTWDPDLSLKIQRQAGLKVIGCRKALIDHQELIDDRKSADLARWQADNATLFDKWVPPAKNGYPDPAPAYQ